MFRMLGTAELVVLFIYFILPASLLVISLVDILKNNFEGYNKIVWVLVVIFLPVIGPILYLIIGKKQKIMVS
jgi:hypothetical protein